MREMEWTSDCWEVWCRTCGTSSATSEPSYWPDRDMRPRLCGSSNSTSGETASRSLVSQSSCPDPHTESLVSLVSI
jgi:hypothetical protein